MADIFQGQGKDRRDAAIGREDGPNGGNILGVEPLKVESTKSLAPALAITVKIVLNSLLL